MTFSLLITHRVHLHLTYFQSAKLTGANLQGANLEGANLKVNIAKYFHHETLYFKKNNEPILSFLQLLF